MALTYSSAGGSNTATLPAHAAGDLIVAFAFRDGGAGPTIPSGVNWTTLTQSGLVNSCGCSVAAKVAASSSETVGTFTNATSLVCVVFTTDISGGVVSYYDNGALNNGSSATVTWSSFTMSDPYSASKMLLFAGHRNSDNVFNNDLTGFTRIRQVTDATDVAVGYISTSVISSFAGTTYNGGGTSGGYQAYALEVYDYDPAAGGLTDPTTADILGTTATVGVSTTDTVNTLYAVVTTSDTQPGEAQIQAGNDHTGSAAAFASSDATPASGANTFAATGLTPNTAYYAHFSQDGARASTAQFTTLNYPGLSSGSATSIEASAATINITTDTAGGDLCVVVTESITKPSEAQIKAGTDESDVAATFAGDNGVDPVDLGANAIVATGLTDATQYYAHVVQETWGYSNIVTIAFQTLAVNPGVVVTLRNTDTDALLNTVTFADVLFFDPADRSVILARETGVATDASGVLTVDVGDFVTAQVGNTVDVAGWNADSSVTFHASATIVDLNA